VFCGSHLGDRSSYAAAAAELGTGLARRGVGLVYGGASVGLMGVVADAALTAGGRVVGVIAEALADQEIAHQGLHRLEVTRTMHERKARMAALSDAVIMLPGGFGTCEEFTESLTWGHLGIHTKRAGILNVDGFFDLLLSFMAHAVERGFIQPELVDDIAVSGDPEGLLAAMSIGGTPAG
jgi:uncharacterized protein (TIGR00730 family)